MKSPWKNLWKTSKLGEHFARKFELKMKIELGCGMIIKENIKLASANKQLDIYQRKYKTNNVYLKSLLIR